MNNPKCQKCLLLDREPRDVKPPRKVLCDACIAWYEALPGWRK